MALFRAISAGYHACSCWVPVAATCGVCRAGPSLGAHILGYTGKLWYDGKLAKRDLLGYLAVELHAWFWWPQKLFREWET